MKSKNGARVRTALSMLFLLIFVASALFLTSCGEDHVHEWGEWETYIESTCYIAGQERSLCSCGKAKYRQLPLDHDFEFKEFDLVNKLSISECTKCGQTLEEDLTSADIGMPVLSLTGTAETLKVEEANVTDAIYDNEGAAWEYTATLTARRYVTNSVYPKKDYELTLSDAVVLNDGWKEGSEYVLYANYADYSKIRSAAALDLYGQAVKAGRTDSMTSLPNGGAQDGFPILLYYNGKLEGIYTLSTPLDAESLGMEGAANQAIIVATEFTDQTVLKAPVEGSFEEAGFDVAYSTFEGDGALASFNAMSAFVRDNDGEQFRTGISQYVDVERAIDHMLIMYVAGSRENVSRNIAWVTLDGVIWTPLPYEFGPSFGLSLDGTEYVPAGTLITGYYYNVLWEKLGLYFADEIHARWAALRGGVLSLANVGEVFESFDSMIFDGARDAEFAVWSKIPMKDEDYMVQIGKFTNDNFYQLDVLYGLQ